MILNKFKIGERVISSNLAIEHDVVREKRKGTVVGYDHGYVIVKVDGKKNTETGQEYYWDKDGGK